MPISFFLLIDSIHLIRFIHLEVRKKLRARFKINICARRMPYKTRTVGYGGNDEIVHNNALLPRRIIRKRRVDPEEPAMSRLLRVAALYIRIHQKLFKGIALSLFVATAVVIVSKQLFLAANGGPGPSVSSSHSFAADYPSSLKGDPTSALVPPGRCQFQKAFAPVPLLQKWKISPTTWVLRFGLPDPSSPLNLSTCACVLAMGDVRDDKGSVTDQVIRPYTPISTNEQIGVFDLLVKDYGKRGQLSNALCNLEVGEEASFSHTGFNVKVQAPFRYNTIGMVAGGTGITPMIQALHAILGDPSVDETRVVLLYSSKASRDILGKELLDSWALRYPDRLEVVYTVTQEADDDWNGRRGRIDEAMISEHFPPPNSEDVMIFVCGPPSLYDALSGPRADKEAGGTLKQMGYSSEQVYKF